MSESKSVVASGGGLIANMLKVTFWDDGNVLHLIFVVVTQVCTFVKMHHTVFFTWVYFIICKLYLNTVFFYGTAFCDFFPLSP